jgi:two-component system response regulator ChvI
MPKMNGIKLLRRLRQKSDIPGIFLTERLEEAEERLGLQTGADDYIHKPFSQRALVERVKSVLRRIRVSPQRETGSAIVDRGHLRIDKERYTCTWKGRGIVLTLTEFRLLEALVMRIGAVQTRNASKACAYGDHIFADERTIDSHMKRVRKKFRAVDEGSIETRPYMASAIDLGNEPLFVLQAESLWRFGRVNQAGAASQTQTRQTLSLATL